MEDHMYYIAKEPKEGESTLKQKKHNATLARRQRERRRQKSRINIGVAYHRWKALRVKWFQSDAELACFLLDSYNQCTCVRRNQQSAPTLHTTQDEEEAEECCAICQEEGRLHSCDKCLRAFHLVCHVPTLSESPNNEWLCSLCRDLPSPAMEINCNIKQEPGTEEFKAGDKMRCERLLLSLYCNDLSTDFQKPDCPLDTHRYKELIKTPMDLSIVKRRLESNSASEDHYVTPEAFVADVRLIFLNCLKYYRNTSKVGSAGMSLGSYFEEQLMLIYPGKIFPQQPNVLLQSEMK